MVDLLANKACEAKSCSFSSPWHVVIDSCNTGIGTVERLNCELLSTLTVDAESFIARRTCPAVLGNFRNHPPTALVECLRIALGPRGAVQVIILLLIGRALLLCGCGISAPSTFRVEVCDPLAAFGQRRSRRVEMRDLVFTRSLVGDQPLAIPLHAVSIALTARQRDDKQPRECPHTPTITVLVSARLRFRNAEYCTGAPRWFD